MRYFIIFLILIGFFSSANAIQYQSSETDKPVNSKNSIHVIPEVLWDIHEVILDGTIVEYNNNTWTYHIKINHVFKGSLNSDLISAEGFDVWNYFEKGDRALFYLYDISPVSANYKYKITDYSVKTSPVCDARSLIQISPILPNDPNRIVRGHPNIPADWEDPCVPDYFSYDPDFFNFREVITPLKQLKHKIPIDKIRCYDDKVLLFRNSNGSPACVKPETKIKLIERGYAIQTEFSVNNTGVGYNDSITHLVFEVAKDDLTFDVSYAIKGGIVEDMVFSKNTNSLLVKIDSTDKGNLTLGIPRNLLDAKFDYCIPIKSNPPDDTFIVLLDGKEIAYDEIATTNESRTLQILFLEKSTKIEVVATCLI